MRGKFVTRCLALFFCALFACAQQPEKTVVVDFKDRTAPPNSGKDNGERPLRIAIAAMVSPREAISYYSKLLNYVGAKYGRQVEIIQRKTYQEVNELLERKELDLAFVCAGPYVKGKTKFGLELLAAPMLYGKAFYQAYFIVHRNSPITDISGLKGKRFAFTDPGSNTGALVPTYQLSRMGYTPEAFFSGVVYTYSHDNSIRAVAKGLVDGASVDGLIWEYYRDTDPGLVSGTKVIYKSELFGIPPVVVHPSTPEPEKARLREILLAMDRDPEGARILQGLKIERFVVPRDSSYDSVRKMEVWVEAQAKP